MRASTELDNLLEVSEFIDHVSYEEVRDTHPEAIGGIDYYKTIFSVGDRWYEAVVNVINSKNVRMLYDVTKLKSIDLESEFPTENSSLTPKANASTISISQNQENTTTAEQKSQNSVTENETDNGIKVMKDGTATKYSLSTWTPETQTKVRNNLVKAGHEADVVDKWINDVNGVASVIAANKDRLDFEAADNQTMLKNNQEYVKTLDASTLCAKRLVYQGTFDAIQHRLPNTVLTSDDLIELANMMKEHGVEAPR